MEGIIKPIDTSIIKSELTQDKFIRNTRRGGNELYEIDFFSAPNTMREIGRLREIAFRLGGGGTGKGCDIDNFDTDPKFPYKQLIVWDPENEEILGGYRYILCAGIKPENLATTEIFRFSDQFVNDYFPFTIELGRSFVQPNYQSTNAKRKSLYALDNLWDGLGALICKYPNIRYFFGKVTMYTSYNKRARNILMHFLHRFFEDKENLITAVNELDYDPDNKYYIDLFKDKEYDEAYKILSHEIRNLGENIPPLVNSYMNLSPTMKVFGTAVNDYFGGVEETGILVTIDDIYPEKKDRHIKPLKEDSQKLKTKKWWNK